MTSLRREDAANRRVALYWLSQGDYCRATGWARLLINDDHRMALLREMAAAPEARAEAERAIAAEVQAMKDAEERRKRSESPRSTPRRGKAKSVAAVPVIEPSEALAGDLERLLARRMKHEKGSA